MTDVIDQFRSAILAAELNPPDVIVADGKLRRFASNGKPHDDAGWYVLYGDGIPAGSFGDWRTGISQTWRADVGRPLTTVENAAHRTKVETMRKAREVEETRRQAEAAEKAAALWGKAPPAPDNHPYLVKKEIKPHGTRLYQGALLIPMRADGKLHSLQFIEANGDKKFLSGGRVRGCYFSLGTLDDLKRCRVLCIAEGFATAATIREATGYPVVVTYSAGNLGAVAQAMRAKYPELRLVLCADDDVQTVGNPGMTRATEAARAVGGLVAVPNFGDSRPEGVTDFNDLARIQGPDAVRHCIEVALQGPMATQEGRPQ